MINNPCAFLKIKTLDNLLRQPNLRSNFRHFLESEFSDENLEFYEAVESLASKQRDLNHQINKSKIDDDPIQVQVDSQKETPNLLKNEATRLETEKIIKTFIITSSPREVNLDACTRNDILNKMERKDLTIGALVNAQIKIYNLMARDSFTRFLKSDFFVESDWD